jgi:ssDNA-binding Zn-finger/Zn-ribbon topoisomerase 1
MGKEDSENMKRIFLFVFSIVFLAAESEAGTIHELKCGQSDCSFKSAISLGGGIKFDQASGYCHVCHEIVSVQWSRDTGKKPLMTAVWDAITGGEREVYACPDCGKGFLAVKKTEDFRHCPKCGKPGVKATIKRMFD